MSTNYQPQMSKFKRTVRKFFVSAFVVFTFAAYAIHERLAGPPALTAISAPTPTLSVPRQAQDVPISVPKGTAIAPTRAPARPTTPPTQAPTVEPAPPTTETQGLGQYKDGDYRGTEIDAYYGLVQVQATIKQGKLTDVQFLEYPNDRRTSIRINRVAIPYLQQEAIQAQSAEVDIVSGATLTSEAFIQSLQDALDSAKALA